MWTLYSTGNKEILAKEEDSRVVGPFESSCWAHPGREEGEILNWTNPAPQIPKSEISNWTA
jgi:hypothetical protein